MNSPTEECRCILCVDYGDRDRWDDGDLRTIDHVNRFGRSCVTIGPTAPEEPPPYAFTAGMWHTDRQPELAIYGINAFGVMVSALNEIAHQASQRGRRMQPGDRFAGALAVSGIGEDDYWLTLMPVHPSWFHSQFGTALHFNRDTDVPFLQAVWPDRAGRNPGDVGFDESLFDQQPQLWLPAAQHPPSVWADGDTRALLPAHRRRALTEAIAAWEHAHDDAADHLDYAVGSTLGWLNGAPASMRELFPDDVEYRAGKAFLAWADRTSAAESTLIDALGEAARELLSHGRG